jgi:hypothetical protein
VIVAVSFVIVWSAATTPSASAWNLLAGSVGARFSTL